MRNRTATGEMQRTWLVQRLRRPQAGGAFGPDSPFSFGGGLRNGGLSSEAMGLLRDIFSFDYMGAAEFEFGAVPEALQRIAKGADALVAFTLTIPLAEVPPNWRVTNETKPTGDATVYLLCPALWRAEVIERVNGWAREAWPRLKEGLRFTSALRPHDEWDEDVAGWLELDNGFFFFTDRAMWSGTCDLFGVAAADRAEADQ